MPKRSHLVLKMAEGPRPFRNPLCTWTPGMATFEVALTEAQEDALRKVFNRVDISGDGHISVIEAIKALRGARSSTGIEADFARLLGLDDMTRIHQEDGTRDKLMLAFGALDADGDKKLSYEEFRRVVASAALARDPVLALDP